jgi:5'(3')-deoxyribonucleotidase
MRKPLIFLDLDNVLVDFIPGALKALGVTSFSIPPNEPNMEKWPGVNCTTEQFWLSIDKTGEQFWAELKKYDYADELVSVCKSFGEVFFLTSPSRNPKCLSGKLMWVQKHFPELQRKIVLTPAKYLCAAPDRVLIDDSQHKTDKFSKFGGLSVLFPQEYNKAWTDFLTPNSAWGDSKVKYVEHYLREWKKNY